MNKIPPNFDRLFAATIVAILLFKSLIARQLYRPFGVKVLIKDTAVLWFDKVRGPEVTQACFGETISLQAFVRTG